MPPKNSTRKRPRTALEDNASASAGPVSRPRRLSEPRPVSAELPHPIAAFLRYPSIEDWVTNYPLDRAENSPVSSSMAYLVALTLATSQDSPLTSVTWSSLPGWNTLTAAVDGHILSIQHQQTGFRADPKMVSFLYGRLAANLGVITSVGDSKMFLPTIAVADNHVFAGNRQATFPIQSAEKVNVADQVLKIIKNKASVMNRMTIPRLAQTTISLLTLERMTDLVPLVTLLGYAETDEFHAKAVEFLETLDVTDGSKAPLVSALIMFEVSTLGDAEKYDLLRKVRAKLSRRSLISFVTNLGIRLPVTGHAINRYTSRNQVAIDQKNVDTLTKDDLVILGSQIATGDAVIAFLERPPLDVYCASGTDMLLYFKSKAGDVNEKIAGTLEDVKLFTIGGSSISQLCTRAEIPKDEVPQVEITPIVVVDEF